MEKIVLGLSGGVDSAVAALILKERGYEVLGLYLDIGVGGLSDAEKAARELGVDLAVMDIRASLEEKVCSVFAESYTVGKTPSPCLICNPTVKFPSLIKYAESIGAEKVATGHYARVENGMLFKGEAPNDQSYMLSRLTTGQLSRVVFPLGGMEKSAVREYAAAHGLAVASKKDSMEICFIPDGDYAAFIEKRVAVPPEGNYIDPEGKVLGRHRGIHHYTLGQRKRLGIALGKRVFVSAIDPDNNTVTLTDDDELFVPSARASDANWLIDVPDGGFEADVRVRHSRVSVKARVTPEGSGFIMEFSSPMRAPTPGQAAVAYIGDRVVCSGWIS